MKKLIFFIIAGLSVLQVLAGNEPKTISGRVTDNNGEPLAGAEVIIDGTGQKVLTNFDGEFELKTFSSTTVLLVVNHISYLERKVAVSSVEFNKSLNIPLSSFSR